METMQPPVKLTADITLAHLMSVDPKAAEMLASIGLEPAEHMNETLRSVCKQRQWSEVEVLQWIKKHRTARDSSRNENEECRDPDFGDDAVKWCDYIEENLHVPNLEQLNEISRDFPRVLQIHGNQYPWLKNMKWYFENFEEALGLYLKFEEKKFFPLIRRWHNHSGYTLDGTIREVKRCISITTQDHLILQNYMDTLHKKGRPFKNPAGGCTTLRILNQNFKMLFENLEAQFKIECEKVIPVIKKKTMQAIKSNK